MRRQAGGEGFDSTGPTPASFGAIFLNVGAPTFLLLDLMFTAAF